MVAQRYAATVAYARFSTSATVSQANELYVVKPPRSPVVIAIRPRASIWFRAM
jgi:hypothetical protein